MTKLSHSAKDKLMTCGALYKYHYIDRIRPNTVGSALFFGGALDAAFNALLAQKMSPVPSNVELDPYKAFDDNFKTIEINGETVPLTDLRCEYFKSDLDPDLTSDPEMSKYLLNNKDILTPTGMLDFNRLAVESLRNKAYMLINAYKNEVIPKINRVYSIQEPVLLKNDDGDEITGFIDFICDFIDEPNKLYICDNKTSSKNYKEDAVRTSEQLATYCDFKLIPNAAYIVLNKTLRKKEPRVNVQILKDTILDETYKKTFDNYENALYTIRNDEFYKNYSSGCFSFGRRCAYYAYCESNGKDMNGLTQLPERKKDG